MKARKRLLGLLVAKRGRKATLFFGFLEKLGSVLPRIHVPTIVDHRPATKPCDEYRGFKQEAQARQAGETPEAT